MWSNIPPEILTRFFKYLSPLDAFPAGLVCRRWNSHGFQSPLYWRKIKFFISGQNPREKSFEVWMDLYGHLIENLSFELDQSSAANRKFCIQLIRKLIELDDGHRISASEIGLDDGHRIFDLEIGLGDGHRISGLEIESASKIELDDGHRISGLKNGFGHRISALKIGFCGENPLFYAGQEFQQILVEFFGTKSTRNSLKFLDIGQLHILLENPLINSLSFCKNLEFLDLQNKQLVCKISSKIFEIFVKNCPKLREIFLFQSFLSNEVLLSFNSGNLEHLSIFCRRMDKFSQNDLSEIVWETLLKANPRLEVTLKFDHTCPLWKVREVMKPTIPVVNLFLETYTMIYEELDIASDSFGAKLKKIVIQSQQSEELESALIQTAERCPNLTSLHVMCRLDQTVIDRIHQLLPDLKDFTLKSELDPHPWVSDAVLDEINSRWK